MREHRVRNRKWFQTGEMRLTSDYRRVRALFNTPLQKEVEYSHSSGKTKSSFEVGPFVYEVGFIPVGNLVYVGFSLADIRASGDELIRAMSKFKKSVFKKEGVEWKEPEQPMTLQEAEQWKHRILKERRLHELDIAGSSIIEILSTVLGIVKDYVEKYKPSCVLFTADSRARSRIYQGMVKSAFPDAHRQLFQPHVRQAG